jgi:hypothetical protein
MAAIAKLNYGATNLSLLDASGLYVAADESGRWIPSVAGIGPDGLPRNATETIPLLVHGTSHDDVASITQGLSDMMRYANNYWRDVDRVNPVWLHSKLDGETNERRALVQQITWRWLSQHYSGDMIGFEPRIQAAIERIGAWEQTTASTAVETAAIQSIGGLYDYTAAGAADVVGTLPARLDYLYTWANAANLSVMWAGIRAAEKHSLTSYDPILDFASEYTPGTDASDVVDATARSGSRMEITFATQTGWYSRASGANNIGDGTNSGEGGDNLALLRAYVDAGTVADIKLGFSFVSADGISYTNIQRIDATSWTIYPIQGLWNNEGLPTVDLWAKRVSGSGSLHVDCFVLTPVDALFLFAEGTGVMGNGAIGNALQIFTRPDNVVQAYSARLSADVGDVSMEGPGIPPGDGRLVVCAARADRASTLTDTLTLKMNHWQRWASLRGNE